MPLRADAVRVAAWAGDFSRDGPGLLLRDLLAGASDDALAPLRAVAPDILLLTDLDYDHGLVALGALRDRLAQDGPRYPHLFALRPNTGMTTDRDLDGDGWLGGPADAQGFGAFSGQGGLALLSRYPVTLRADLSGWLWRDVPDSAIAPDDPAHDVQRLSSTAHWILEVATPPGPLTLLTLAATPPVFDGPADRNGRRNRDEVLLWAHLLDRRLDVPVPDGPIVLLGDLNLDPDRGEGRRDAVRTLLTHPRLQDPLPGQPTVTWRSTGPMRVVYVLPDAGLRVTDAGVAPPAPGAGPHGLVWVDLSWPAP